MADSEFSEVSNMWNRIWLQTPGRTAAKNYNYTTETQTQILPKYLWGYTEKYPKLYHINGGAQDFFLKMLYQWGYTGFYRKLFKNFLYERSFLHKMFLNVVSLEVNRKDNKYLKPKIFTNNF